MPTTTIAAIRDEIIARLVALVPNVESANRFIPERGHLDFRAWAESHASSSTRRVAVVTIGDAAPPLVSNTDVERVDESIEVVVAYQKTSRFGARGQLDLADVVASDLTQLTARIGTNGFAIDSSVGGVTNALTLTNDAWRREVGEAVVFGVLPLRVSYYRAMDASVPASPVTIDVNGTAPAAGDSITGSDQRLVVIANGLIRVTFADRVPAGQRGAHMLEVLVDGVWGESMEYQYGDAGYFCVSVAVDPDRTEVLEVSDEAVEIALHWDAFDLTSMPGGGALYLDGHPTNPTQNYTSGAVARLITETHLTKSIRVQRGEPGYYIGWHSDPIVGPLGNQIPTFNRNTSWGERETHLGGGAKKNWSSNTAVDPVTWPDWAQRAVWDDAGLTAVTNRIWMPGICDPNYNDYGTPAWAQVQPPGFPQVQAEPPFYVGDLHYSFPVAKVMVQRPANPQEIFVQLSGVNGDVTHHFMNEEHSEAGIPYRHQTFIGGVPYHPDTSDSWANEPTAEIRAQIHALARDLDWPTY